MKPIYFASACLLFLIAVASCTRKNCCEVLSVEANTWLHDSVSYSSGVSRWNDQYTHARIDFEAAGYITEPPTIAFFFVKKPSANGKYRITQNPKAEDEMSIMEYGGKGPGYASTGSNATAFVTVSDNGKIIVYGEQVPMKEMTFVGGDTTRFSFNVSER